MAGGRLIESLDYLIDMITGALISLLAWVIGGFSLILPTGSFLPANFSDLVSDFISYAYGWDWLVPMGTLFSVFGAIIIFMIVELSWRSGRYLVSLLRGN